MKRRGQAGRVSVRFELRLEDGSTYVVKVVGVLPPGRGGSNVNWDLGRAEVPETRRDLHVNADNGDVAEERVLVGGGDGLELKNASRTEISQMTN